MKSLFEGKPLEVDGQPDSVVNILGRYQDVQSCLMEELRTGGGNGLDEEDDLASETLPRFTDWLMENVYFVEITADTDADAYAIFETMNDRGLSLTPSEMLKGYLLSNIDKANRDWANVIWKERVQGLHEFGNWADAEAIKAWLRSRHARRERLRGDSEEIENQFHRWVRENERHLGLTSGGAFADFIRRDFEFYCRWYRDILDASWCLEFAAKSGLEVICDECELIEPGFCRFVERSGLPFFRENPEEFRSGDIDARQALYAKLAQRIWNVEEIRKAVES